MFTRTRRHCRYDCKRHARDGKGLHLVRCKQYRDSNGCEGQIIKTRLLRLPVLHFNYSNLRITPDQCLPGQGAIAGMIVKDMQGTGKAYTWFDANNTGTAMAAKAKSSKQGFFVCLSCILITATCALP